MISFQSPAKRVKILRKKNLIVLVLFCVVYALVSAIIDSPQRSTTSRFLRSEGNDAVKSKRAIAMISFGESAAKSTLVERAVLSIRRRGKFDGQVVLITDAPEERYNGVFDENVIVMQSKDEDMMFGYFQNEAMKYKRFKTLIPKYFDSDSKLDGIQHIYYMDIDMMMAAPFEHLVQGLDEEHGTESVPVDGDDMIFMFKDPMSNLFVVNSGFIVMDRKKSNRCLDLWRDEMDANPTFIKDQLSLNELVTKAESGETSGCQIVAMQHHDFLDYTENEKRMIKMMDSGDYPVLVHLYNSCKAEKFSEEKTEVFVNNILMLTEKEKKEHKFGKAVIKPSNENWAVQDNSAPKSMLPDDHPLKALEELGEFDIFFALGA
ncbi:hypothetical protein ACHAXS_002909 [Conticribra weissflogii]